MLDPIENLIRKIHSGSIKVHTLRDSYVSCYESDNLKPRCTSSDVTKCNINVCLRSLQKRVYILKFKNPVHFGGGSYKRTRRME